MFVKRDFGRCEVVCVYGGILEKCEILCVYDLILGLEVMLACTTGFWEGGCLYV